MKEYIERMKAVSVIKSYEFQHCPEYMQDWATKLKRAIIDDLTDDMMEATAADVVERKRGEWEWFEEWNPSTPDHPRECEDCGWRCGKCKTALEDVVGGYWDDPTEKPKLNFCPICGADMREVDPCTE